MDDEDITRGYNSISGSSGPETSRSVNPRTRKKILSEEELKVFPQDRVELSREVFETQHPVFYQMTNNPDLNRYIETLNQTLMIYYKNRSSPPPPPPLSKENP